MKIRVLIWESDVLYITARIKMFIKNYIQKFK